MRVFYLYQINDLCYDLYRDYPHRLFSILKDIYYTSKYNQSIAISSYEEVTLKFNRDFLKEYIFQQFKLKLYYRCDNYCHYISSSCENSELLVSSYSLKLKSNINYPSFFDVLNDYGDGIFVCDFINQDYFWLERVINKNKNVVKE